MRHTYFPEKRRSLAKGDVEAGDVDLGMEPLFDASALRRLLLNGILSETRAAAALEDYLDLPLTRHGHQALVARILSLRTNFSAHDATYVALAERLGGILVTGDRALARATGDHLNIQVVLAEEHRAARIG